ncbi:branched-chain amino acid ABC transporter permease [Bradyrhizobium sp. U87765 SZCCT0131]|uniref:branched-chain amino acid ABC transporter permease n=1 Tax=unclassified Bradyrhizobium TaxID=2631580 RepID=UPI001BAC161E|nr:MULTISPECIES: branched-chain amino acid ABC transporter permease [unclassified Bradyrhizobium]MBR1217623.1 branched-chain amino acid ABC transporter permease [Bradyrhizobium sp. U87765 SZCCT0131]MBR1261431.1 branched-chain amino acid ABC transporter permease [Bradyrhizobium sp. U87765 SZCCT0134]MBR1303121.1 branched-chain amino acid ABC transporter permease [Bradyrhizobium sp. U87765 SZCCT0110]MBR1318727.1 branched-chain amino acid ABC transporter permease [Bradyrhizobium sp. U87765 SZCCT010
MVRKLAAGALIGLVLLCGIPLLVETYTLFNLTVFAIMAIFALSLALVWGFAGILSLGQSVFFGLGAYAYAITAINFADSTPALVAAIIVPVLLAALIGYFAFFGRVTDVYFGVISLTVSLIFYSLVNSTSGQSFTIGNAPLGGYNGIPSVPPVNWPFAPDAAFGFHGMYYLSGAVLLAVYLGLRLLLASPFGRICIGVRESEARAELLGYDVRMYKLGMFCIGAGVAGLAGALFAAWGSFVGPDSFSVGFAAQAIIWVMFGGLGTLIGPVVGCIILQAVTTWLGQAKLTDPNIVLGIIFIAAVLLLPQGVVPALDAACRRLLRREPKRGTR